jgi:hypothetical protein
VLWEHGYLPQYHAIPPVRAPRPLYTDAYEVVVKPQQLGRALLRKVRVVPATTASVQRHRHSGWPCCALVCAAAVEEGAVCQGGGDGDAGAGGG